MNIWNKS